MKINRYLVYIFVFAFLCFHVYSFVKLRNLDEANEYMNRGDFLSALEVYKKNINRFSDESIILYKYSMCLFENKEYEQAYDILKKVLLKYPDPKILTLQAKVCIKQNNYEEAENILMKATNIVPNKFESLYWLFTLYKLKEDKEKAVKIGKYILNKKVKIESYYIDNLKNEIASYIENENLINLESYEE